MAADGPIHYLSIDDLLAIRDQLARQYRDTFDILRGQQLLSALAAPEQHLFGEELFPTICAKAAALLVRLIKNHPFWDGNKRIALAAATLFLARNGYTLTVSSHVADQFTTRLATGEEDEPAAQAWIEAHVQSD